MSSNDNQNGNGPEDQMTPQVAGQSEVTEEPDEALPEISLADLPQALREAVARAGWTGLMPVQSRAMPYLLEGRDIMVQARTGSGKTGAFVLPIIQRIKTTTLECQALILVPTRELAKQVAHEAEVLAGENGPRVVAVYGGVGYKQQLDAFEAGAHIVVGTPGRILDHLMRRSLSLKYLKTLIFDEADRMLSIGFYPDMRQIQTYLPPRGLDAFMFSATYPLQVLRLADEFLRDPSMLSLSGEQVHVADVEHTVYEVPAMGRERCLMRILETENPTSAIIFCNTKADVHFVTEVLKQFGYNADELSADLSQSKRERVLNQVRDGKIRFLVATDVAARGIDIPELSHVILYQPPEDPESYIHRAGRTGRAGAAGTVISLVDVIQKMEVKRLATKYDIDMQKRELPTDEDVARVAGQRLTALLDGRYRGRTPLEKERITRFYGLARELAETEDGQAVLAMLLDELYQTSLHVAPEPPQGEPPRRPQRERRPPRSRSKGRPQGRPPRDHGGQSQEDKPKPKRRRRRRKKKPSGGGEQG